MQPLTPRTTAEIREQALQYKAATPELAQLNNTSKTSVWSLFLDVVARVLQQSEKVSASHLQEIERLAQQGRQGSAFWYAERVRAWQYNHLLITDPETGAPTYAETDPEAQLADQVAVLETANPGELNIKVATTNGVGDREALQSGELASLAAYLEDVKIAGTHLNVTSIPPDQITATIAVTYDAQLDQAEVETAVESAIGDYFKGLDFNALYRQRNLEDAIQAVTGVTNVVISSLVVEDNATPPNTLATDPNTYTFAAGYGAINSLTLNLTGA